MLGKPFNEKVHPLSDILVIRGLNVEGLQTAGEMLSLDSNSEIYFCAVPLNVSHKNPPASSCNINTRKVSLAAQTWVTS